MATETGYKLTTQEHKEYCQEILNQLGGRQFIAMVGANSITFDGTLNTPNLALRFKGSNKANYVKVTLDPDDTYTVKFHRLSSDIERSMKPVKEYSGVYCDMLQDIFTSVTGLYTTLGTLGR